MPDGGIKTPEATRERNHVAYNNKHVPPFEPKAVGNTLITAQNWTPPFQV